MSICGDATRGINTIIANLPHALALPIDAGRSASIIRQFGVTLEESDDGHLTIARIVNGGPAEEAGLQRGDEILMIDDHPVGSVRNSHEAVESQRPERQS